MVSSEQPPPPHTYNGHEASSNSKPTRRCSKGFWIWTALILVVSGVSLALSLTLTRNKDNSSDQGSKGDLSDISGDDYYEYLYQTIGQNSKFWVDPSSAQASAAEWLSYQDNLYTQDIPTLIQRYALVVLYYSTGAVDRDWLVQGVSECDFDGIRCDQEGVVTGLHLTQRALSGPLPPEIGLLDSLTLLNLKLNRLKGTLPDELFLLTNLVELDLSVNQLAGSIPAGLGRLTNLGLLSLSENILTGSLPDFPTSIEYMLLENNLLSSRMQDIVNGGSNLVVLELSNNNIQGTIPTEVGKMSQLASLMMAQNDITGTLPSEIGLVPLRKFEPTTITLDDSFILILTNTAVLFCNFCTRFYRSPLACRQ